jgi:hypothetical protein
MMESYSDETLPTPLSNTDPVTPASLPDSYYRDHSLNYRKCLMSIHTSNKSSLITTFFRSRKH